MIAMACARKIRAISIAMRSMGPQEGITRQIGNVRIGRACTAALDIFSAEAAYLEAMLVFDHQGEIGTNAWKIQIQDEQDFRVARMVDLYDDGPYPHEPF